MLFTRKNIFEKDETHPRCHCSVIQELPNGELMAVWYAGKREAHKSVGLKASWLDLKDGENEWKRPRLIHKTKGRADGNGVIIYYQGQLHLYYNVIKGWFFPWTKVILNKKLSNDFGRTWTTPETIIGKENKGYTVRNKPIIMGERLIIPTGKEKIFSSTSQMLYTDDGKTYHFSEKIEPEKGKCHQPTIVELKNGDILAYLRTNQDKILKSKSKDKGETWTKPKETGLYNPNSALDMVLTEKEELILVWNNNPKEGGTMKSRKILHCGYSPDKGKTWPIIKEIEKDVENGRFAYPSIIQTTDGTFHLTYTNRRTNIRHVHFDLEWLLENK